MLPSWRHAVSFSRRVRWFRWAVGVLLVGIIAHEGYRCLDTILTQNFHEDAYELRMTIDSRGYRWLGQELNKAGVSTLFPDYNKHSVAMQTIMAFLERTVGYHTPKVYKVLNFLFWCGSLLLVFMIARLLWPTAPPISLRVLTAVALVSLNEAFQKFCATLQYEVLVAFGFLAVTACVLRSGVSMRPFRWAALAGVLTALIPIVRMHYVLIAPVFLLLLLLAPGSGSLRRARGFGLGFLLVAISWNAAYSISRGRVIFYQDLPSFHLALNPNAYPYNFPMNREVGYPKGLEFPLAQPRAYLELLRIRTWFLVGYEPDVWYVESKWTLWFHRFLGLELQTARRTMVFLSLGLFFLGLAWAVARFRRGSVALFLLPPLLAILAGQLVVGAAMRFLIPALPLILVLQLYGLVESVGFLLTRARAQLVALAPRLGA